MPLISKLLYPVIRSVRNSAANFGGHCTWEFSQTQDPVASLMAVNPDSAKGICQMLATKWLEGHANDDHIANWIMTSGGQIDASKVRYIMQLFIIGLKMNPTAVEGNVVAGDASNQRSATHCWLQHKGIIRRHGIVPIQILHGPLQTIPLGTSTDTKNSGRAGGSRSGHAARIATAIANDIQNGSGHYAIIEISGPREGHAMAAWISNDVTFFDPNFGEFYFSDKADFIRWFPTFFRKSFYYLPIFGLCERYATIFYAKSV